MTRAWQLSKLSFPQFFAEVENVFCSVEDPAGQGRRKNRIPAHAVVGDSRPNIHNRHSDILHWVSGVGRGRGSGARLG